MPILHDFSQLLCQEFSCKHKNAAKESWQQDRRKLMDKLDQSHKERVSKKNTVWAQDYITCPRASYSLASQIFVPTHPQIIFDYVL